MIDTGIDVDHPEFDGAIDGDSRNIINGTNAVNDPDGHGTAVAGVIGARKNDTLSHGVAFDSDILAIRAARSCDTGCTFTQGDIAAATDYAVAQGARVINMSLGGASGVSSQLETAFQRAVDAGVILVFAAGNSGASQPTFPARFASGSRADGRAIAVGAVNNGGSLASFSNRAGNSREVFLVAPGVGITAPRVGGGTGTFSGTSFAAPHAAGALALLLEASPFLSADEAVELLLSTSEDLGADGTDGTYGRGLLNLKAALRPAGDLAVPLGNSVDSEGSPLATTGMALGPAFGPGPKIGEAIFLDGYGRPFRLDLERRVRNRDGNLDLHPWFAPGTRVHAASTRLDDRSKLHLNVLEEEPRADLWPQARDKAPAGFSLTTEVDETGALTVMHDWQLGGSFGLAAGDPAAGMWLTRSAVGSPFLAHADGGDGLTFASDLTEGVELRLGVAESDAGSDEFEAGTRRVAVAEVARTTAEGGTLALQLGSLAEQTGLLGSTAGGAMALGDAATNFIGIAGRLPIRSPNDGMGTLHLFAHANYGLTDGNGGRESLIQEVSTLHSTAFGAGVASGGLFRSGDRLALGVAQPNRIHQGDATLDLPVARTFDGTIRREQTDVDLAPAGQEIDIEAAYQLPFEAMGRLDINWLTRLQPGHDPDANPAHAMGVKWHSRF